MSISNLPTLIIPDIHQDIDFLKRIRRVIENQQFHRVIFLGDYFDTNYSELDEESVLRKFCRLLKEVSEDLGQTGTFLWGNHDLPYYLARHRFDESLPVPPDGFVEALQGFSYRKAGIIEEELGMGFWNKLEIGTEAGGYLLTHAGLNRKWCRSRNPTSALKSLKRDWEMLMGDFQHHYEGDLYWLAEAGVARGGEISTGGPLWQDWQREFKDIPGIPQIVGHSRGPHMRNVGRSFCVDCSQSGFAILSGGNLRMYYE